MIGSERMKAKTVLSLLCMAVLMIHCAIGEAAHEHRRRGHHHSSAASAAAQRTKLYDSKLTEAQSLRALEAEISRKLGSNIQESDYPQEARREGWSGTTRVDVLVGRDGKIKEVSVQQSSG